LLAGPLLDTEQLPDGRRATWSEVDRPTLVLGSTQPLAGVDRSVAADLDVDVVRRRSGGGGVLLWPGEHLWLDVVVPRDDPLWRDDVGASMWWLGEVWCTALAAVGVRGRVHHGRLVPGRWSREVCFAGTGAGEVLADRAPGKLVGIAQRRTRDGAWLQSMCHLRWRPEVHAALIAAPRPSPDDLAALVAVVAADAEAVESAVVAALAAH
jgi:lipoate-protein ligase A